MIRKIIIALVIFGCFYGLYLYGTRNSDVTLTESLKDDTVDYKLVTFTISGEPVTLEDGVAELKGGTGSEAPSTVRFFGNEVRHDLDGNGSEDVVFLITQELGGSGTFYYAVGALDIDGEYVGTDAVFIGDRIAPQSTSVGEGREVVVNYADRAPGEPMTASPSVGKSMRLLLDVNSRSFGEVVSDFEGEADTTTFRGEVICLTRADGGVYTNMACALGLKTAGGLYYALDMDEEPWVGADVTLEGMLREPENDVYDIEGVIEVLKVVEVVE